MNIDILAIGSHPDDIELSVGGTLLKLRDLGYSTGVIDLTRGEMGTRGTPEIRAQEAQKAAEILGLTVRHNLGLQDGNIWCNDESRIKMVRALRQFRPKVIFTHSPQDPHPDHAHASQLVREAAHLAYMPKYDKEAGQERHQVSGIAHFLFSRSMTPTFLVDISNYHDLKWKAVQEHASQFYNPNSNDPKTRLSSKNFIEQVQSVEKYFGFLINAQFAEGFVLREALNVEDPMTLLTRPMNPYS